jgi:hypothetical protein
MNTDAYEHYARTADGVWHRCTIGRGKQELTKLHATGPCDITGATRWASYRAGTHYTILSKCAACEAGAK